MNGPIRIRIGTRWLDLHTPTISPVSDGRLKMVITGELGGDLRDLRVIGEALRPYAHKLAGALLRVAANPRRSDGKRVSIPVGLLSHVAMILLALPSPRRGRPPKPSTLQAQQLLATTGSKRRAAQIAAGKAGVSVEIIRRRLRPSKPGKPKGRGGT